MNKYCILIIICLIVFACKNNDSKEKSFPGKIAVVKGENLINRIDYRPTMLKIDLNKTIDGDFKDYFSLKKVIYLDKKSPIGQISTIRQYKDKLFVLDSQNTQQLYCYDLEGKLIWEFKAMGKGPLEYNKISDFVINEQKNTIDVLDSGSYKIINLDIDTGVAKTEFKLGFYGSEMVLYKNNYLLHTANLTVNNDLNYKLLLVNTNQEIKSRNLPVYDYEKDKYFIGFRSLEKNNGTIYFTETLNDTIYNIKDDKLKAGYYVNFLDKKFPTELKKDLTNDKIAKLNKDKLYIESIDRVTEKNGLLSFIFSYKKEFYTVFYDINKKSTLLFKTLKKGTLGEIEQILFDSTVNDGYIKVIEPYFFDKIRQELKSNKKAQEHLIKTKPEMYDVIMKTNENSNPIFFVYEFKKRN